jgi:hypothetical protein
MQGRTTPIQLESLILWSPNPVEHNSAIVRLTQWQQPSVVLACLFNSTERNEQSVDAEIVATIQNIPRASTKQTTLNVEKQADRLAALGGQYRPFADKFRQLAGHHDSKTIRSLIGDSLDQQRVVAA